MQKNSTSVAASAPVCDTAWQDAPLHPTVQKQIAVALKTKLPDGVPKPKIQRHGNDNLQKGEPSAASAACSGQPSAASQPSAATGLSQVVARGKSANKMRPPMTPYDSARPTRIDEPYGQDWCLGHVKYTGYCAKPGGAVKLDAGAAMGRQPSAAEPLQTVAEDDSEPQPSGNFNSAAASSQPSAAASSQPSAAASNQSCAAAATTNDPDYGGYLSPIVPLSNEGLQRPREMVNLGKQPTTRIEVLVYEVEGKRYNVYGERVDQYGQASRIRGRKGKKSSRRWNHNWDQVNLDREQKRIAAKKEAERKVEEARVEAERVEAERVEAERVEDEGP